MAVLFHMNCHCLELLQIHVCVLLSLFDCSIGDVVNCVSEIWGTCKFQNIQILHLFWVFESQPRHTYVVKTGSDNSTAKRSAIGVSVTGPWR